MTDHTKGTTLTLVGALLLFATVVIRHSVDNPAAKTWADLYLPILGFISIAIGMYFSYRGRQTPKV